MKKNFEDLKNVYEFEIFRGIKAEEMEEILQCLNAKSSSFKKGGGNHA